MRRPAVRGRLRVPLVLLCEASADPDVDDAVTAGIDDYIAWETVESHPQPFASRVAVAVDAGRHRRGEVVAEPYRDLFEQVPDPAAIIQDGVNVAVHDVTVTVGPMEGGFSVADDGRGIPAADREAVLQPGYTTGEDGSGFGLAIVQTIAAAHGWDVSVAESETAGARFEFTGVESA